MGQIVDDIISLLKKKRIMNIKEITNELNISNKSYVKGVLDAMEYFGIVKSKIMKPHVVFFLADNYEKDKD